MVYGAVRIAISYRNRTESILFFGCLILFGFVVFLTMHEHIESVLDFSENCLKHFVFLFLVVILTLIRPVCAYSLIFVFFISFKLLTLIHPATYKL